eukprot:1022100-Alexandrium_andersonii.AAC.1
MALMYQGSTTGTSYINSVPRPFMSAWRLLAGRTGGRPSPTVNCVLLGLPPRSWAVCCWVFAAAMQPRGVDVASPSLLLRTLA